MSQGEKYDVGELFPAIFSPAGTYTDFEGKTHLIKDMDSNFKRYAIIHLIKAFRHCEKRREYGDGRVLFSGRFTKELAEKLNELGLNVVEMDGIFETNISNFK